MRILMGKKPHRHDAAAGVSGDDLSSDSDDDDEKVLNTHITLKEITSAMQQIKSYRAAGEDEVQGEFLKYLGKAGIKAILALFNLIFTYQCCPACWCKDMAWPIHKAGDKRDPGNYRLITLMSVICKLFERP